MNIKRLILTIVLGVSAHLMLSAYGCQPVIENNGFDLWCGDQLCLWELDSGEIERVSTWHKGDFGVSFLGQDVRISQYQYFTDNQVQCLQFSIVADVSVTADMVLQLDLYDDGVIDYEQPILPTRYAPIELQVVMPERYAGVRFIVHKRGTGDAVVAQLYASDDVSDCAGTPIELAGVSEGIACETGDDCVSGICNPDEVPFVDFSVCGECASDDDCGGDVCGVENPSSPLAELYRGCGEAARHGLGERCIGDAECTTGICNGGVCSTCVEDTDCGGGRSCVAPPPPAGVEFWLKPTLCSPGAGSGAPGGDCLNNTDCASGKCKGIGALGVCQIDGRLCGGKQDCPRDLECLSVGTAGGTCQ